MAELKLYNSLSKSVENFSPQEPGKARVYNCGPTVYKRQHIGNMRRFLFADFLRRTLEFLGYEVRDITNITDVGHLTEDEINQGEDKVEKAAREAKKTPQEIVETELKSFMADIKALNITPAHLYPRASQHIPDMHELITTLLERGHAYITSTGVYFDVKSFPAYGKLSGNTVAALEAGSRVEVREEKRQPADFALWILDTTPLQKWDSPWGVGYPGWHIECSAMSLKYLGSNIDIHTGGEDNRFPHHENEIAQSEGATGNRFVNIWMHNRHLQIGGKKMAKREGEAITLDTLREKGISPLAFRLYMFSHHYRNKIDFLWEDLTTFTEHLETLKQLLRRLHEAGATTKGEVDKEFVTQFTQALADDLNTPEAWAVFLAYITAANKHLNESPDSANSVAPTLRVFDSVLGVIDPLEQELRAEVIPTNIQALAQEREIAKQAKQFERADTLRSQIEAQGYKVEDTSFGPRIIHKRRR